MKHFKIFVMVCCYVHSVRFSHSARILGVFNFEMLSHFQFHEIMMKSLASAGHHVTMIAPFKLQHPHENITAINSKAKNPEKDSPMKSFAKVKRPFLQSWMLSLEIFEQDCRNIISLVQEKNLRNFDLMFLEMMPMNQCYISLAKQMGIPVIGTLSFRSFINLDLAVGHIRNPSTLPTELFSAGHGNVKMNFYERLTNFIDEMTKNRIGRFLEERKLDTLCNDLFSGRYCQNLDIALAFINNHASLQITALAPNVVNIGGINVKAAKLNTLPEQLEKFIDEAKHGVILFSLGSMASSDDVEPHLASILKNTFAKIPQRVIWKSSGTMRVSDNVLLSPWIPQKEILAHKNVVAFISHCGLSSTYEAIYFSKPMILLPIFADQPSNAGLLKYLGVGVYLNILELTEEKLQNAIIEVTSNQTYNSNMKQLSQRFKDELKTPEELVIYWTEYVLKHNGDSSLRSVTADTAWYQYLLLDVSGFVCIVSIFVVVFMYVLAKYIILPVFRFLKKEMLIKKKKL